MRAHALCHIDVQMVFFGGEGERSVRNKLYNDHNFYNKHP